MLRVCPRNDDYRLALATDDLLSGARTHLLTHTDTHAPKPCNSA